MRIRALLFIPALAAAVLGIGVNGASAATLFTTAGHTAEVTVGATADATSTGPIVFTSGGSPVNSCPHANLGLRVDQNSASRVVLTVTSSVFAPGCSGQLGQATGTHTPPWKLTITGNGSVSGTNTVYAATIHNVAFDTSLAGFFSGNLETGITASQVTVGTAPVCVVAASAGTVVGGGGLAGTIDARFCLTGPAATWSLTN